MLGYPLPRWLLAWLPDPQSPPQPRMNTPMVGDIVHYRHRVHGCLAAVITSPVHADNAVDLWQFPAERAGQPLAGGHLPAVPRGEHQPMHWHRPTHGCA